MQQVAATDFVEETSVRNWRKWGFILLALLLVWVAYALTPLVSLGLLIQSARSGDEAAVSSAIDFPKLRRSIARQLVVDQAAKRTLQPGERQLAVSVGTASVSAWLEEIITPQSVGGLLSGKALALSSDPQQFSFPAPELDTMELSKGLSIWWASGFRGPLLYTVMFPAEAVADQLSLDLALAGFQWRVVSIGLSPTLRQRLSDKVAEIANKKSSISPIR